jgi:hypothetical protein
MIMRVVKECDVFAADGSCGFTWLSCRRAE